MLNRLEQQHSSPKDVPPVGRPRGAAWRSLQADGVVWEGQVVLVGGDVDLAARMIVTHRRVAFVRGGEIVLEIPRGWLRQEPVLRRDGTLELFVTTPESNPFDEPMRVPLRMREGHPAAGHIIAMLAPGGVRRIAPDALSAIERAREATPTPSFGGFWDGIESASATTREPLPTIVGRAGDDDPELQLPPSSLAPLEPPDRLLRVSSSPSRRPVVNGFSIAGLPPRDQRRSSWGLLLRLAALTILLATAAALGAGRLHIEVPGTNIGAILAAPTATAPTSATTPTETAGAALTSQDLTAVAVGVGGENEKTAAGDGASSASQAPAADDPAVAQAPAAARTKPAIPTPAPTKSPAPAQTPAPEANSAQNATAAPDTTTPAVAQAPPETANVTANSMMIGSLRVTISTALRGETLPKYGLPPGSGEWILLMADITNEGSASAAVAMNDFRLLDRGTGVAANLDTGTDVIASLAGYEPARGANDTIALEPGAAAQTLLLYLLPAGSGDQLSLQAGQASLDLTSAFAAGSPTPGSDEELIHASRAAQSSDLAFMRGGWRERLTALSR